MILSLTFQLKANDYVWSNFVYLFTNANEGRKSKTKDSVYSTHLNFRSFFSGKKCALYTGKYGNHNILSTKLAIAIEVIFNAAKCFSHRMISSLAANVCTNNCTSLVFHN